jgi:hypothetical protein
MFPDTCCYGFLRNTLYPQTLALTSPTSGGRSVGIVRLRTTATEFSFFYVSLVPKICPHLSVTLCISSHTYGKYIKKLCTLTK